MGNQFSLDVVAALNTSNIPKELQELNTRLTKTTSSMIKIPIGVDAESGKKVFQQLIKDVRTYKDELNNTFKRTTLTDPFSGMVKSDKLQAITDSIRTLTTETHKWTNSKGEINTWKTSIDEAGQQIQKRTKQYINDSKELVTETSNWGKNAQGQWVQLSDTIRNVTDDFKQSSTVLTTETHKFVDSKGAVQTWTTTIDDAGKTVSVRTKEIVDDMGNIITTTSRLEAEAGQPFKKVGNDISKVSEILKETTSETNTVVGQITDTIDGVTKTFNGTITTIKKVSSNGEELTTVISRYKDDLGRTIEKTEQFNKANQQVATTMRKISEATPVKNTKTATFVDKDGNKIITEYVNNVATLRTEIKQYTDDVGNLIVKTEKYDAVTNQLISSNEQLTRNIQAEVAEDKKKEQELDNLITKIIQQRQAQEQLNEALVSTTTTHSRGKTTQFGGNSIEYDALITKVEKVNAANEKVIQTTYEFTNAQGQLVRQTRTTDQYLHKVAEDVIEITDANTNASSATDRTSSSFNKLGTSAERANYGVKNLGWSLSDAFSRLANFYLASLPIRAVQTAISDSISTLKEFDSALIEFRKVSDLAGESLTKYVAKLAEMGEITGSTMQAMVEASTEFKKSGFTEEDSAQLASIAEKYRNIADEEISAGDSASFIIAQMKAFNIEAGQAEHIIDAVNEVANNYSVSSADLAKNLGNMSEIMAINNVSMEQQIGMLTGVTEITRNASSASRGLVMISSRLTQVLDDTSSTGKKLTKIYEGLGIELKDSNGQLRSHYDILGDLASKWDELSENEQKYIALTSAGARQQQNFVALMDNWSQVIRATGSAYESIGSAQKENEKVMDSIAKKVEILKSEFQQLIIGNGGLQDFAKAILNIGIAILKFANSDIGKTIIQITLLITTFNLLQKAFTLITTSAIPKLTSSILKLAVTIFPSLQAEIAATGAEAYGLSDALMTLNTAMMANPVSWLVAGLTVLVGVAMYASKKTEEHIERIKEAQEEVKKLKVEIYELKKAETEEAGLTKAEEDRLTYLEKRLELEEKLANLAPKKKTVIRDEFEEDLSTATETGVIEYKRTSRADITRDELSIYRELNEEIKNWNDNSEEGMKILEDKYNQSQTYLNSLEAERDSLAKLRDEFSKNSQERQLLIDKQKNHIPLTDEEVAKLEELKDKQTELSEKDEERLHILEANIGKYHKNIDAIHSYSEAIEEFGEDSEEAETVLAEFAKELQMSEQEILAYAESLNLTVDEAHEALVAFKNWNEEIDNIQSALGTLQGAVDEYNESQYLSLDTVQSLLALSPEYLGMLTEENGQLKLNQEAIIDKVNALVEEQKQTAITTAIERLRKLEIGESSAAEIEHKGKVEDNTAAIRDETNALYDNAKAYATKIAIESNGKKKGAADQILADLDAELAILKKVGSSFDAISSKSSKAGRSASKGAKDATNAQKELNKELEETKKKYESAFKWIKKQYDNKIDSIKDAKKAATDAVDKEIKALEKEKDAIEDNLEAQIKALEKEKEARQKYWEDRIDILKKENEARKDALELQEKLDALERAKNTRVKIYKEGQGFVYDVDQTAVAEAQKELDEYLSEKAYEDELARLEALKDAEMDNYEKRLDALNEYKDNVSKNYEKQIDALKEHKDQLEEQYDAEIKIWENYKDEFEKLTTEYEDNQSKLLAEEIMHTKLEGDNWLTRLDNLKVFVNEYNKLLAQMDSGNTNVSHNATMKESSGGSGGGYSGSNNKSTSTSSSSAQYDSRGFRLNEGYSSNNGQVSQSKVGYIPTEVAKKLGTSTKVYSHASGVGSVKDNEIAIVGENPNQEIVIGSKLNNGALMSLNKGSGVVNADSSSTLAGMLNQVGKFGSSGFGSGNGTLNNNINNDSLTINGVTIQGANINDPQTFVNGLLSLKSDAIQRAYRHR